MHPTWARHKFARLCVFQCSPKRSFFLFWLITKFSKLLFRTIYSVQRPKFGMFRPKQQFTTFWPCRNSVKHWCFWWDQTCPWSKSNFFVWPSYSSVTCTPWMVHNEWYPHTDLQAHLSGAICPQWKLTSQTFREFLSLQLRHISRQKHLYPTNIFKFLISTNQKPFWWRVLKIDQWTNGSFHDVFQNQNTLRYWRFRGRRGNNLRVWRTPVSRKICLVN